MRPTRDRALLNGTGIECVKQQIERAFAAARCAPPNRHSPRQQPQPLVRQQSDPARVQVFRHAHRHDAHVVAVPKESVAELFALAERAIDDLKIPLQNDARYDVSD